MADESLVELVARLRRLGLEPEDVEVKEAVHSLPKSTVETLSAFANGKGGTLLLGLSEAKDFTPVEGFRADRIRDSLAEACSHKLVPAVRAPIEVVDFEDAEVVRLVVDSVDPQSMPCYVLDRGEYNGSFIRSGDGDRRLNHYEVSQLLTNMEQPQFDRETVPEASFDDLDSRLIEQVVAHARNRTPRAFAGLGTVEALKRLGAVTIDDRQVQPTLAGMLSLGTYPQEFFPQLFMSFVVVPGREIGSRGPSGERFYDNLSLDGPLPEIVEAAMNAMRKHMSQAAIIRGIGREDRYDYPVEALREVFVNALLHRDYSPEARGAQVQVELYPDRLVVRSPGGLFGNVTEETMGVAGAISTSRNGVLAKLLSDVTIEDSRETLVENRGSGLVNVVDSLRRAGMSPPEFLAQPGSVTVTIQRASLLSPETIEKIGDLGLGGLSDAHHLALAMMINTGRASTAMLKTWGVEPVHARAVLKDLVELKVVVKRGGRRYAWYHLDETFAGSRGLGAESDSPGFTFPFTFPTAATSAPSKRLSVPEKSGSEIEMDAIKQAITSGARTAAEIEERIGLNRQAVLRRLKSLRDQGEVERTGSRNSPKQSYRLVGEEETP